MVCVALHRGLHVFAYMSNCNTLSLGKQPRHASASWKTTWEAHMHCTAARHNVSSDCNVKPQAHEHRTTRCVTLSLFSFASSDFLLSGSFLLPMASAVSIMSELQHAKHRPLIAVQAQVTRSLRQIACSPARRCPAAHQQMFAVLCISLVASNDVQFCTSLQCTCRRSSCKHSLPLLCNPVSCFAVVYGYHNRAHLLAIVKHAVFIVDAAVAAVRCSGRCLLHPPVSVHFFAQLVWQHSNQQHISFTSGKSSCCRHNGSAKRIGCHARQ